MHKPSSSSVWWLQKWCSRLKVGPWLWLKSDGLMNIYRLWPLCVCALSANTRSHLQSLKRIMQNPLNCAVQIKHPPANGHSISIISIFTRKYFNFHILWHGTAWLTMKDKSLLFFPLFSPPSSSFLLFHSFLSSFSFGTSSKLANNYLLWFIVILRSMHPSNESRKNRISFYFTEFKLRVVERDIAAITAAAAQPPPQKSKRKIIDFSNQSE